LQGFSENRQQSGHVPWEKEEPMRVNGVWVTMPPGQAEALLRTGLMVPRVCVRCGAGDAPENRVFFRTDGTRPLCDGCWRIERDHPMACG
jgi:hypothetical protein